MLQQFSEATEYLLLCTSTRAACAAQARSSYRPGLKHMQSWEPTSHLPWTLVGVNTDGSQSQPVTTNPPAGNSYFPGESGMSGIYGDLLQFVCPTGSVVVGMSF
ncbi:hypothetical protein BV25DRAFT_1833018 [Artomyces pyxidatus]|uniref:Uncharacterized protein n=1 Tax=Artomyces pyxidatus TaxID=48021 RepID=A0ACB8SI75_9AGAM|nr:hypothetical protein BV25DRAFT_1833018 [Artomyces pyxidatus]